MEDLNLFFDEETLDLVTGEKTDDLNDDSSNDNEIIDEIKSDDINDEVHDNDDKTSLEDFEITPDVYDANYGFLVNEGFLVLPDDYKFEPTQDGFKKALEESNKNLQEIIVQDMFSRVNDKGKLLLNYFLNGGTDINKFQEVASIDEYDGSNLEDENVQKQVIESLLKQTTSFTKEEIKDYIDDLEINDKLESKSQDAVKKLSLIKREKEDKLKEEAKLEAENARKEIELAAKTIKETITSNKNLFGVPVKESDAQIVLDSFYKPIRLKDGSVTTSYEMKYIEAMNDPKKAAIIALLLEKDFDFGFVEKRQISDSTKDFKKKLNKAFTPKTRGSINSSGGSDFDYESATLIPLK